MEAEVREMEVATLAALEAVDGPGWRVVRVGGGQRGLPSHDADFVVTHDTDPERWVDAKAQDRDPSACHVPRVCRLADLLQAYAATTCCPRVSA